MNVRPEQLADVLKRQLHPVYLISGDEPLQVMESSDAVRAACREQDYIEREVFDVDTSFDWQMLEDEANSLSLFSSRRILEVRMPSAKPGREGGQALKAYAANLPEDTVLLITAGKLEAAQKKSAWFKALDQAGVVMQCWPIGPDRLPAWVRQRFLARDMQAGKEVIDYVCQRVEGNLLAAAQEIDKLNLLVGPGAVDIDSVREAVADSARFSVFELADSALAGDRVRVIRILQGLHAEGIEPILVTWALAKDIRLLTAVSANRDAADYALKQAGVWQNRLALYKSALARHSTARLKQLLQRCAKIDGITKGQQPGNVWDELQTLGYILAG
ncbi:MAG: DNA polymerase III subunit delta [Gammaproteobacteria bacterium]|nr:DNA polymerase III subunit delta [Gammaproteobacteria bacterium]